MGPVLTRRQHPLRLLQQRLLLARLPDDQGRHARRPVGPVPGDAQDAARQRARRLPVVHGRRGLHCRRRRARRRAGERPGSAGAARAPAHGLGRRRGQASAGQAGHQSDRLLRRGDQEEADRVPGLARHSGRRHPLACDRRGPWPRRIRCSSARTCTRRAAADGGCRRAARRAAAGGHPARASDGRRLCDGAAARCRAGPVTRARARSGRRARPRAAAGARGSRRGTAGTGACSRPSARRRSQAGGAAHRRYLQEVRAQRQGRVRHCHRCPGRRNPGPLRHQRQRQALLPLHGAGGARVRPASRPSRRT